MLEKVVASQPDKLVVCTTLFSWAFINHILPKMVQVTNDMMAADGGKCSVLVFLHRSSASDTVDNGIPLQQVTIVLISITLFLTEK